MIDVSINAADSNVPKIVFYGTFNLSVVRRCFACKGEGRLTEHSLALF